MAKSMRVRVIIFIILASIVAFILSFIPLDILLLGDNIVMTESEFDSLIQSGKFELTEIFQTCSGVDVNSDKIREYSIKYNLFDIVNIKNLKVTVIDDKVFVGGKTLGFSVNTKGVIVVGSNYILTPYGKQYPMQGTGIEVGDIIVAIDDKPVISIADILDILQYYTENDGLEVDYIHEGKECRTTIYPALDIQSGTYKLGLWLKEDAMGVGTLTYVDRDSEYGALGHAISLDSTGQPLDIVGGNIYNCNIVGVKVGSHGQAGQLLGSFNAGDNSIGSIEKNSENGAFGVINDIVSYSKDMDLIDIGGIATAKPGKASILSCIAGKGVKEYDIEIIKTNYRKGDNKSMVIRITDPELLAKTGGIVQGMSGSPIIQDGKLIGAVTHVFLNDATKGFGLYIDWMIA